MDTASTPARPTLALRVEYTYDPESGHWMYEVPALHILGVGCESREEAARQAAEAVIFTLEADDGPESAKDASDVEYLELSIA